MRYFVTCLLAIGMAVPVAGCGGGSKSDKPADSYGDRVARARKLSESYDRARSLVQIGRQQADAMDTLGAEDTLELAAEACGQIDDPGDKTRALSLLAVAYYEVSERSSAKKALVSARKAADGIENLEIKARRLIDVAEAFGRLNDVAGATDALALAEDLTDQLKDPEGGDDLVGRTLVLGNVAVAYHKIGRQDEADQVTAQILKIAGQMETDRRRSEAIAGAALAYSEMDDRKTADTTFTEALEVAREIVDPLSKAHALADIAEKLSQAGFHAKTHEVLEEADLAAHKIPEPDMQMQTIQKVRTLMGKLPKPKQ